VQGEEQRAEAVRLFARAADQGHCDAQVTRSDDVSISLVMARVGCGRQLHHTCGSFAWRVRMKTETAWRQVSNAAAAAFVRKTYCFTR
jgi:hypothetical protein